MLFVVGAFALGDNVECDGGRYRIVYITTRIVSITRAVARFGIIYKCVTPEFSRLVLYRVFISR